MLSSSGKSLSSSSMARSGRRPYTACLAGPTGQRRARGAHLLLKELIMLKSNRAIGVLLALNLAGAALAMHAQAATVDSYGAYAGAAANPYGSAASANSAQRAIDVTASTRWVNVANGETVRFNVDGQSFVWNFGTLRGETSFDLSAIAPKDLHVPMVRVYVASNPLYRG